MSERTPATPLSAVLTLSFICSMGTGVFWHGIPFIAEQTYGFSQVRNLWLAAAMGVIYTLGAFAAGRIIRLLEGVLSPRSVLGLALAVLSLVSLAPILASGQWALWFAAITGTYATSLIWPLIESYISAGRHGAQMRSAIGWFNVVWAAAVALPMFAMGPILEHHGEWAIGGFSGIGLAGLVVLRWFQVEPGHHDEETADAHIGGEYPLLLSSARVLLPLSYVLNSALNPILPYRLEALGLPIAWKTPAAATWIVVRLLTFVVLWRLAFWHGRWGMLLLGAVAMTGGFGLVVGGPTIGVVLVGFAVFGAGLGIVYYAALYYAMAVGRAAVEAGGTHEALIGSGYSVGPLLGLGGTALSRSTGVASSVGIIATVWAIVGVGGIAAVRPYLRARHARRR